MGHVDHGKTTLLDQIRGTTVAAREPGAITQHIGASFVPASVLETVYGNLLKKFGVKIEIPGLLFIDTPGHSAFSNLRKRGGSVADIAILVIDLMKGVEQQTIESIDILRARKTPFIIAANKLDVIPGWKSHPEKSFTESAKLQDPSVLPILDEKIYYIIGTLSMYKFNAERFDRIKDFTKTIAIIPVSAKTGEGLPELLVILAGLAQQFMKPQLSVTAGPAKGTVLEVREDVGLGVNINAIIYDGILHENDLLVIGGKTEPFTTKIRALLLPKPLDEIRDPKEKFKKVKEVAAAAGVKIVATGLEEAIAGSPLYATPEGESPDMLLKKVKEEVESVKISTDKLGIIVKADTLGSLEALINELKNYDVPIRIADIGDVSKREVLEATIVKTQAPTLGVILSFNVKVLPDAMDEAMRNGVKIFQENIVYRLIEEYMSWTKSEQEAITQKTLESLILPGKIKMLPGCVFRRSDPAIFGVEVLAGRIKTQYPLVKEDGSSVGKIVQIQDKGQKVPEATQGMQVAISLKEPVIGRHIREGEILYVEIPESHLKTIREQFQSKLNPDEIKCVEELTQVMRKKSPYWGM
jgi:translation initiation factor 5B